MWLKKFMDSHNVGLLGNFYNVYTDRVTPQSPLRKCWIFRHCTCGIKEVDVTALKINQTATTKTLYPLGIYLQIEKFIANQVRPLYVFWVGNK